MIENIEFIPQQGFQERALSTSADIAVLGGSAGAGKTFTLLMEQLRNINNPNFGATLFRRTFAQITMEGGLLDESKKIYPYFGATYNDSKHVWQFPSGAKISFRHLQHEKNIYDYQGAQIPLISFDEFTHFSEKMFLYLLSRNRSISGIKPYMRCTCNPDPESFVYHLIEWWIDPKTGYPIPERDGVIRYFTIDEGKYIWGDSKEEVIAKAPYLFETEQFKRINKMDLIKSLTFIRGDVYGNKKLLEKDPTYLANLMAQDADTKSRLLDGNWKFSPDASKLMDIISIRDAFTNEIYHKTKPERFITIDHARFGKDLCTITTWEDWNVLRLDILSQSDTNDIIQIIKDRRMEFGSIRSSNIIIDQDGIGVKDKLKCRIFIGSSKPFEVKKVQTKFENKKAQCYYKLAEKINEGEVYLNMDNVYLDGKKTNQIKLNGETKKISLWIEDDLRTMKRGKIEDEFKYRLISKEEQKIALGGRSPDFGDNLMMRSWFEFAKKPRGLK